ncbi:MAG: hypothetical protein ACR2IE_05775 [Candidatus Sumerlaeaceae bacterium]
MVVAIIAILALIALPNFLDAQVRSKVSRARADMRTVVTAVEAYAADQTNYAPPISYLGAGPYTVEDPAQDEFEAFVPMRMTTPVAYLTSLPSDPFWIEGRAEHPPRVTFHYSEQKNNTEMEETRETFIQDRMEKLGAGAAENCRYFLASHGPDLKDPSGSSAVLYDPTNGTVSPGDLYYFGPGLGPR